MSAVKSELNLDLDGGKLASLNEFKVCLSCPGSHVNKMINHSSSDIIGDGNAYKYTVFWRMHVVMIRAGSVALWTALKYLQKLFDGLS